MATSIRVPEDLAKEVYRAMEEGDAVGYKSLAEFGRDAIREKLKEGS